VRATATIGTLDQFPQHLSSSFTLVWGLRGLAPLVYLVSSPGIPGEPGEQAKPETHIITALQETQFEKIEKF